MGWTTHAAPSHSATGAAVTNFAELLLLPVRVHLLTASNAPCVHTTLSSADVDRILGKVNRVWAAAGIHFYSESLVREVAARPDFYDSTWKSGLSRQALFALRPQQSQTQGLLHVYYLKEMAANGVHFPEANFVKDTASLREVPGGIDEPLPRVTAHELGHALSLVHRQNETNLMASRTTGTSLNAEESHQARTNALSRADVEKAGEVLRRADALFDKGDREVAMRLYQRLVRVPVEGGVFDRVRNRSLP